MEVDALIQRWTLRECWVESANYPMLLGSVYRDCGRGLRQSYPRLAVSQQLREQCPGDVPRERPESRIG